ncbi:NAD-dependent epimerase/dehydratase family protein, partial [Rhodoferax sp.]
MPSLHILVTGGTGFLGQALCRMLLAQGHSLTLWVRNLDKG